MGNTYSIHRMYEASFEPFHTQTGPIHPSTTQETINYHRTSFFRRKNKTPFVSPTTATFELLRHNNTNIAILPAPEQAALYRLASTINAIQAGAPYGPDLAIKAFTDLDLTFFAGHLNRNVCVNWSSHVTDPRLQCPHKPWATVWGVTLESQHPSEKNQCRIILNAETIFSERAADQLGVMMATLLHEMCHAYEIVRCAPRVVEGADGLGHDEHFETRVCAVHERAMCWLGVVVVGEGEGWRQRHWL